MRAVRITPRLISLYCYKTKGKQVIKTKEKALASEIDDKERKKKRGNEIKRETKRRENERAKGYDWVI